MHLSKYSVRATTSILAASGAITVEQYAVQKYRQAVVGLPASTLRLPYYRQPRANTTGSPLRTEAQLVETVSMSMREKKNER